MTLLHCNTCSVHGTTRIHFTSNLCVCVCVCVCACEREIDR